MTKKTELRPNLKCHHCGHAGSDYRTEANGQHTAAHCGVCGSYIKFLSKEDKYGTKEQRRDIWNKTGGRCYYCGVALNPFTPGGLTYDHMIPQSRDGEHLIENLVLACKSCNSSKNDKTVEEYREYIRTKTGTARIFYGELLERGPKHISDILKALPF